MHMTADHEARAERGERVPRFARELRLRLADLPRVAQDDQLVGFHLSFFQPVDHLFAVDAVVVHPAVFHMVVVLVFAAVEHKEGVGAAVNGVIELIVAEIGRQLIGKGAAGLMVAADVDHGDLSPGQIAAEADDVFDRLFFKVHPRRGIAEHHDSVVFAEVEDRLLRLLDIGMPVGDHEVGLRPALIDRERIGVGGDGLAEPAAVAVFLDHTGTADLVAVVFKMGVRHMDAVDQPVADPSAVDLRIDGVVRPVKVVLHKAGPLRARRKDDGVVFAGIHHDRVGHQPERLQREHQRQRAEGETNREQHGEHGFCLSPEVRQYQQR